MFVHKPIQPKGRWPMEVKGGRQASVAYIIDGDTCHTRQKQWTKPSSCTEKHLGGRVLCALCCCLPDCHMLPVGVQSVDINAGLQS